MTEGTFAPLIDARSALLVSSPGRALIRAVYEAADHVQAVSVYWLTQEFNAEGRAL